MNKFSILAGLVLGAGSLATAQVSLPPVRQHDAQKACAVYDSSARATAGRTAPRSAAPASIVGKRFVTFFRSFSNYGNAAGWIVVESAAGDSVLLRGICDGYDLTGKYDPATGRLTIPTGKPIGTTSAGVAIISHNLLSSSGFSKFNNTPVVATVTDDGITFADGFYASTAANAAYVRMQGIYGRYANGTVNYTQLQSFVSDSVIGTYSFPIYVIKSAATELQVQGLAAWLYGHNYKVPVTLYDYSKTAKIFSQDSVDWYKSGGTVRPCFLYTRNGTTGSSISANVTYDVTAGDTSRLVNQKQVFECFPVGNQLSGWILRDFKMVVDFNVFTAPISNLDTVDHIIYQCELDAMTAEVLGCDSTVTDLNIPETIQYRGKTYTVTSIDRYGLSEKPNIVSVTLPRTMRKIGAYAFYKSSNIRTLNITDLKAWCGITFGNSSSNPLSYIFYSQKPEEWGQVKINGEATTELTIPDGVESLSYSFNNWRSLTKVTFPATLKYMEYAFQNCWNLTGLELPAALQEIGPSNFHSCKGLTSVEVPRSVETLGISSFYGCSALSGVKLHTGLKHIMASAFSMCPELTSSTLPATVYTIGSAAFFNDTKITSFTCKGTKPAGVYNDNVFKSICTTCTLYVPESSIDLYKAATGWKTFTKIARDTDAVTVLEGDDAEEVAVYYTLTGVRVDAARLAPGIYVEVRGNRSRKVIVR